ncbi:hypothetical protein ACKC9G_15970 [Pokkaliibacter sp. CJK22405]|uniref:hypothetical protein n=1 Tax=Pokkaliibacter sp. CJK22405 TaxID=3384615 RepID=UPI0039853388
MADPRSAINTKTATQQPPAPPRQQNNNRADKQGNAQGSQDASRKENRGETREVLKQDALLFQQMMMPSLGMNSMGGDGHSDQQGMAQDSDGARGTAPMSAALMQMCQKISDQMPPTPAAFECSLLMPHLGEVMVKANPEVESWQVKLIFQQQQGLELAKRSRKKIGEQLTDSFGRPVNLSLALRGDALDE